MQIDTRPAPAKKNIDASIPKNISFEERAKLEEVMRESARRREESIANENRIPTEPSVTLKFQLRKFGKHWQAYCLKNGKPVSLLAAPSILSSALDALNDEMTMQALNA